MSGVWLNGISGSESLIWCTLALMMVNICFMVFGINYAHLLQELTCPSDQMLLTNVPKSLIFMLFIFS
jgi:hypothetical protein